jgi:hypothetical protein
MILMPWCPKCKAEYTDGTQFCADCGCPLTYHPPQDEPETPYVEDTPAFLTSVENGLDGEMLQARLESAGIPCYMKRHDNDGLLRVYMGPSNIGADFYVPTKLLEKAKVAIGQEPQPGENESGELQPSSVTPGAENAPSKKPWSSILTAIVILLVLIGFFSLDALLDFIRKLFGY